MQTPELLQDIEIPDAVTVLGQSVDLTALKAALQPLTSTLRSAVAQVRRWPAAIHSYVLVMLGLGAQGMAAAILWRYMQCEGAQIKASNWKPFVHSKRE